MSPSKTASARSIAILTASPSSCMWHVIFHTIDVLAYMNTHEEEANSASKEDVPPHAHDVHEGTLKTHRQAAENIHYRKMSRTIRWSFATTAGNLSRVTF